MKEKPGFITELPPAACREWIMWLYSRGAASAINPFSMLVRTLSIATFAPMARRSVRAVK
jgi:hypothetical protein